MCQAILDHLYTGTPTGEPRFDGFAMTVQRWGIRREWFDRYCDGLAAWHTPARIATWKSLRAYLAKTAGEAARILYQPLVFESATADGAAVHAPPHPELVAWATAAAAPSVLKSVSADWKRGRLMIPLDDLVSARLTQGEFARLAIEGGMAGHDQWLRLLETWAPRVTNVLPAGVAVAAGMNPPARNAFSYLTLRVIDRWTAFTRTGGDPSVSPPHFSFWNRIWTGRKAMSLYSAR